MDARRWPLRHQSPRRHRHHNLSAFIILTRVLNIINIIIIIIVLIIAPFRSIFFCKAGQVTLAGNNGPLSACFFAMCRQAAPFDLRWRVTVYNPPTGLFDWRRTAVPAGMKLDTKRVTVDEPLKFFQRHKITQYNTTTLPRSGTDWAKKHDRSSLRVLGTMEESITSETHDVVREKRCSIVDILGQTR